MGGVPRAIDETIVEKAVDSGYLENDSADVKDDLLLICEEIKGALDSLNIENKEIIRERAKTLSRIRDTIFFEIPVDGFIYENLQGEYLPVGPNLDMHGFDLRGLKSDEPIDVHNSDLREANLIGVDISNWNLDDAKLDGVKFCEPSDFEEMQDKVPDGYLLQEDGTLIAYVG